MPLALCATKHFGEMLKAGSIISEIAVAQIVSTTQSIFVQTDFHFGSDTTIGSIWQIFQFAANALNSRRSYFSGFK